MGRRGRWADPPRTRKADSAHPTGMLSLEFLVMTGMLQAPVGDFPGSGRMK